MPVEPAPRKVRTPDEPALRRKDELITFWAERITQKIPFAADFPHRAATRHRTPQMEKNSIKMRGDSIYSYGEHFEIARIIRHPGGTARIVLCNGDRWSGSGRWGGGTFGDQMTTQRLVRKAIEDTNIDMMIVPFSTLDAANIELESVEPIHVREDRREYEHHVYTERPGPFHKMDDPSGATAPHIEQRWGHVHNETGEVIQHVPYSLTPEEREQYTWKSYDHVTERPVRVDDETHAYVKEYGRGNNRHWYGDAELQADGTWLWVEEHHRLGDSLFRARYTEHTSRKATTEERAQYVQWEAAIKVASDARHEYESLGRKIGELQFVRSKARRGRPIVGVPIPSEQRIEDMDEDRRELWSQYIELESQVPKPGRVERSGNTYTVPFTRRRWAKFLSSFDYNEPNRPYFMCQLPTTDATTIEEALDALMPGEVRTAIELGLDVIRQGDVYAIPTAHSTDELKALAVTFTAERTVEQPRWQYSEETGSQYVPAVTKKYQEPIRKLRGQGDATVLGTNHSATHVILTENGDQYGRGTLYHTPEGWGRRPEHVRVKLGDGQTWYRFVKNLVPLAGTTNWRRQGAGSATFQSGQSRAWMLGGGVD